MIWLHFIFSAALVIGGGFCLARCGQELGERYGLTDIWIGFIFLAAVTSIPELSTALGAVTVVSSPSLALSDVLGSNSFNLFALGALGLCFFRRPLNASLGLDSFRLLIGMIILMTGLVLGLALLDRGGSLPAPGKINLVSWALLGIYFLGSWKLFRDEHPPDRPRMPAGPARSRPEGVRSFYPRLLLSVVLVVAGGFWLAWAGSEIAGLTGWGDGFVGALFLALVTSLPEVSVCLGAVRICAPGMALGNILGSNVFNLGIIFWADLAYRPGSILAGASGPVLVSAGLGIVLVLLVALSLRLKPLTAGREIRLLNIIIILVYLIGMRWIFRLSAG